MNDEYIKREAVIKGFTDMLQKPGDIYPTDITTMMQRVPAEDVRPVVRGEWIWEENEWQYRCSVCRITFDYDKTYELFDHDYQYANFCPNCGADMRGE